MRHSAAILIPLALCSSTRAGPFEFDFEGWRSGTWATVDKHEPFVLPERIPVAVYVDAHSDGLTLSVDRWDIYAADGLERLAAIQGPYNAELTPLAGADDAVLAGVSGWIDLEGDVSTAQIVMIDYRLSGRQDIGLGWDMPPPGIVATDARGWDYSITGSSFSVPEPTGLASFVLVSLSFCARFVHSSRKGRACAF